MIEYIGLLGTIITLVAFTRKNEFEIRMISIFSSLVFFAYAFILGAWSIMMLNVILIGIHINRLIQLKGEIK